MEKVNIIIYWKLTILDLNHISILIPVKKKKSKAAHKQLPSTATSKVDDNVRKLLKLSSFKLNDKLVQTAFKRSASRHYTLPPKEKAPEEAKSVFTEEDFARFAAEYTVV